MSLAKGYYDRLQMLVNDIQASYDRLNKLQSVYDKKVSAIYHDIEKADLSKEGAGQECAVMLQKTLHERRAVKDEFMKVQSIQRFIVKGMPAVTEYYSKAVNAGYEVRSSLNSNLPIEEVLASLAE